MPTTTSTRCWRSGSRPRSGASGPGGSPVVSRSPTCRHLRTCLRMTHPSNVDGVILPKFAWRPVSVVTAIVVVTLGATVNEYGYFRDELYFRVLGAHPAWGYVDEPPLTPLLGRGSTAIFGDSLWALRLPATLCAAATLSIVALIARERGGGAYAQTVAAIGATASFLLVAGHVLLTA